MWALIAAGNTAHLCTSWFTGNPLTTSLKVLKNLQVLSAEHNSAHCPTLVSAVVPTGSVKAESTGESSRARSSRDSWRENWRSAPVVVFCERTGARL